MRALLDPAIWATSPAFARLAQRKDRTELLQRFKTVTTLSTTVAVYVSLSLLFYGKDFITVWVGENYASAYTVTLILTPAAMLVLAQAHFTVSASAYPRQDNVVVHNISICQPVTGRCGWLITR